MVVADWSQPLVNIISTNSSSAALSSIFPVFLSFVRSFVRSFVHQVLPSTAHLQLDPPPPLCRLVVLVCRDEGHAMRAEVRVQVTLLVEAPPTNPTAQGAVLAPDWGGGRAVWGRALPVVGRRSVAGATVASAAATRVGVAGLAAQAVRNEAVTGEGAGGGETGATLGALQRALRPSQPPAARLGQVLRDVLLELRPVICGEAARRTPEALTAPTFTSLSVATRLLPFLP